MKHRRLYALSLVLVMAALVPAQDRSVKPGINDKFRDPNVKEFVNRFEVESREIFASRQEILAACKARPGMAVADVGAGTGLFTRLFADRVGPRGKVYAVDIAPKFLSHIKKTCKEAGVTRSGHALCRKGGVAKMAAGARGGQSTQVQGRTGHGTAAAYPPADPGNP